MKRPGGTLLLAVVLTILAAGCSAGQEVEAAPLPEAEETAVGGHIAAPDQASTTSSLSPPLMPPVAATQNSEGAVAFVRYWFETVEYAYSAGDTEGLRAAAEATCETCQSVIDEIEDQRASGQRTLGLDLTIESVAAAPADERGVVVTVVLSESPSRVVAADGSVVQETPGAADVPVDVFASTSSSGWRVFGIGAVES